jgi:hypothetical protein
MPAKAEGLPGELEEAKSSYWATSSCVADRPCYE